jgi:adenylate cyclase
MAEQMPAVGMERKLAAIFSTDVAGYSRLMGDDEEATIRTLTAYRAVISSLIQHHRGRVVDSPGDNLLAEFASVVDAVRCAVEIQHALREKNAELPERRQMQFRIGINLGDVIVEGERLYGDGVNVAARLESLALPGGICISGTVYDHVENKLALNYEYQGEQAVKNIAKPVRTYRVVIDETATALVEQAVLRHAQHERVPTPVTLSPSTSSGQALSKGGRRGLQTRGALVLAGLVFIAGTVVAVRYLSLPISTQSPIPNTQAAPAALLLPNKPSIVVLPFTNMSGDPEQEYFNDGMTDTLITDLSQLSDLFVIARNSAFIYKGKPVKVQEVSKELGVRYALEGSVQKANNRVRINVQLIDATTSGHVWAERYDRELQDIFALQDEVTQRVVAVLQVQLTAREQERLVRRNTDNVEAYDALLRGRAYYFRYTKESNTQARQTFERAIALDPRYADAHTLLGITYWLEWVWNWSQNREQSLERFAGLAHQAITLGDSLPGPHVALGYVYLFKDQQFDQGVAELQQAASLAPNNADVYFGLAEGLNIAGRPTEALGAVQKAMCLNPHYPANYPFILGWTYWQTGQYAKAIPVLKDSISRNPNFLPSYVSLATSYRLQWLSQESPADQTLEPALAAVQRALVLNDSYHRGHINLGYVYLYQQQYDQALEEMERGVILVPTEADSYAALAEVLSRVGRIKDALEAAARALHLKPQVADEHLASVGAAYAIAGHYAEARDPLQRYLSRFPNILPGHLLLAVVYSELGQAAEAQQEAAEVLRFNLRFSLGVHKQRIPIKDPVVLEQHIAALRKAGLK